MRKATALLVFVTVSASAAAAEEFDRARLRGLVQLPTLTFLFGVGVNSEDGIVLMGEKVDAPAEIAALLKQMKGDASDAERYHRLARLYSLQLQKDESKQARARATELYRQRAKADPRNGYALAQVAQTLEVAEAEPLLRQAVKLSPDDWRCWVELAKCQDGRAVEALFGDPLLGSAATLDKMLQVLTQRPVAADVLRKATREREEAKACYDKAVSLAGPRDAGPYTCRTASRCFFNFVEAGLDLAQGKQTNPFLAMFSADCLPDLREAARRNPEDFKSISLILFIEVLPVLMKLPKPVDNDGLWKHLPEEVQRSARVTLNRLEELTQHRDPRLAAGASEVLGMFSFFIEGNMNRMTTELRRAVSRDPSRDHAWEGLIIILAETGSLEAAEAVCRERLRRNDSAHFRLLLIKVLAEQESSDVSYVFKHCPWFRTEERFPRAERAARAALEREPRSARLHHALAALMMKSTDAELPEAGKLLDQAEKLLGDSASSNERGELQLNRSLYLALSGKPDEARERLRLLLRQDQNNKKVQQALAELEKGQGDPYKEPQTLPPVPRRLPAPPR